MKNDILRLATDDDLRAELERRARVQQAGAKSQQLAEINLEPLRTICQEYIDDIANNDSPDENLEHYIFETAVETFFGKDIWQWIA